MLFLMGFLPVLSLVYSVHNPESCGPSDPHPLDHLLYTEDLYQVRHRVRHTMMARANKVKWEWLDVLTAVTRRWGGGGGGLTGGRGGTSVKIKKGDPGGKKEQGGQMCAFYTFLIPVVGLRSLLVIGREHLVMI